MHHLRRRREGPERVCTGLDPRRHVCHVPSPRYRTARATHTAATAFASHTAAAALTATRAHIASAVATLTAVAATLTDAIAPFATHAAPVAL